MLTYDLAKSKINLVKLLVDDYGFFISHEESSKVDPLDIHIDTLEKNTNYTWILRRGGPTEKRRSIEKIGVSLVCVASGAGRWLYIDNREHGSHGKGSVIDWVLHHHETIKTPKQALKYLEEKTHARSTIPALLKAGPGQERPFNEIAYHIEKNTWVQSKIAYLLDCRGISEKVLSSERFIGTIRTDKNSNAIFVHSNFSGICGYSVKNFNYTSFSSGGKRGVWCSNSYKTDKKLVVTESAIDALSYFQYYLYSSSTELETTRFISIEGRLSADQLKILLCAFGKTNEVVLAFDADYAGSDYEEKILDAVENPIKIFREFPPWGLKDFNEIHEK